MSDKKQAFIDALNALQEQHGFRVVVQVTNVAEQFGAKVLVTPVAQMGVEPIPDWTPKLAPDTESA